MVWGIVAASATLDEHEPSSWVMKMVWIVLV
jgi:hypothetical protein